MNKWSFVVVLGWCVFECQGREPFKPAQGSVPYVVYFKSRYRGLCVGSLVSRTTVLTAAVCVTNPVPRMPHDLRPINIVCGASYRHPRRGIRVQVTKIIIPNLSDVTGDRSFLLEKSPAVLILKRKLPDVLTEIPMRAIEVDWMGEEELTLQEECFMPGWHFFYKGDIIYPVAKFLLQRNLRVQFMNIVKMSMWCEALNIKFQKALSNIGYHGTLPKAASVCVRDTDKTAQPCHGMYGAPLICRGKVAALLMAPDAQWSNCTGFSNVLHLLSNEWLRSFFTCVHHLFYVDPDDHKSWSSMQSEMLHGSLEETYDYIPSIYDKIYSDSDSGDISSD